MVLQIVILILEGIHLVFGVFGIPISRMRKGAGLFGSILLCWGLEIIWALTWCIILPAIVSLFGKELCLLFPDAIGVGFVVILGCIPSAFVCTIAYGIVHRIERGGASQMHK